MTFLKRFRMIWILNDLLRDRIFLNDFPYLIVNRSATGIFYVSIRQWQYQTRQAQDLIFFWLTQSELAKDWEPLPIGMRVVQFLRFCYHNQRLSAPWFISSHWNFLLWCGIKSISCTRWKTATEGKNGLGRFLDILSRSFLSLFFVFFFFLFYCVFFFSNIKDAKIWREWIGCKIETAFFPLSLL